MSTQKKTKRLRGKYQLTRNTFVTCYLDVLDASKDGIYAFIGLKSRADTVVPVGMKIFFNAEAMTKAGIRHSEHFDVFSITVQEVQDVEGQPLLLCTPINKETRPNLRKTERKTAEFPVTLVGKQSAVFMVKGGTAQGLSLYYTEKRAILSLALGRTYVFAVDHKDTTYNLPGEVKHIQYDWKTHAHLVGVYFPNLAEKEEAVLNLLLDPEYVVPISEKQTVDTALGKISDSIED